VAGLSSRVIKSISCSYTSTPDSDFIIGLLPGWQNIWLVSACSGHGFKHSAAVGEIVSQLLIEGRSEIDISAFQASRFA
jgi:glycine/D-amino acid oxidase-like deaminating enzyme